MVYPVRFLLPDQGYKEVSIEGIGFPEHSDLTLTYNEKSKAWASTLMLPSGCYYYHFKVDNNSLPCPFRSIDDSEANLFLGVDKILFFPERVFIRNNQIMVMISMDTIFWQKIRLNIQCTFGSLQNFEGIPLFYEGTRCWFGFFIPLPQEDTFLAYFELKGQEIIGFYSAKGFSEKEWAIEPFELNKNTLPTFVVPDVKAIYRFSRTKEIQEFEKRIDYFKEFCPSYLDVPMKQDSPLLKIMQSTPQECFKHPYLSYLIRDIFSENEDINASLSLLGRFYSDYIREAPFTRIQLSDDYVCFWDRCRRNIATMMRAATFQLLCTNMPDILFGEEIGLGKIGDERRMYWTKAKWNKTLLNHYEALLKLREEYPVLRTGHVRYVIQDCAIWGIERFMEGEDSIFIFANNSKDTVVLDLTKFVKSGFIIKELISHNLLKRKRICTLLAESVTVYGLIPSENSDDELI